MKMANQNRLSLIKDLLRRRGTMSASDLARECKVSESTIQKDIRALSDARVAVCFDGGYRLRISESRPDFDLTTEEMLSLYVGLNSHPVQSVGCFREAAERALSKIESLMSESINGDYETAKKHVAIQPGRNRPHQGAELIFELMRQALWSQQRIRLHHVSPLSSETVELTPKALLYKKDGWYLAGQVRKSLRYFRLDFIKDVSLSH